MSLSFKLLIFFTDQEVKPVDQERRVAQYTVIRLAEDNCIRSPLSRITLLWNPEATRRPTYAECLMKS
jgi:hypothetical protein